MTDLPWKTIIVGEAKSWVAYRNGTCVVLAEPAPGDLEARANAIMREYGPVAVGCSAGDFSVIDLLDDPGYVVTSHHPDVLTYVGAEEVTDDASSVAVGLLGRHKRSEDARDLEVVHVEDRR